MQKLSKTIYLIWRLINGKENVFLISWLLLVLVIGVAIKLFFKVKKSH